MSRMSADMRSFKNCSSTFLASWASAPVEVPLGTAGAGGACERVPAGELVWTAPLVVSGFVCLAEVAGALFAAGGLTG